MNDYKGKLKEMGAIWGFSEEYGLKWEIGGVDHGNGRIGMEYFCTFL